jgi:uncharacterized repeat protein (TIGR02543 family)
MPGVTATSKGDEEVQTITLKHAENIPAGAYYVTATETGKIESGRILLVVNDPILYRVTFDKNYGGAEPPESIQVVNGEAPGSDMPPDPSRTDGFSFAGWNKQQSGSVEGEFDAASVVTGPLTVYAQWEFSKTIQISLDDEGEGLFGDPNMSIAKPSGLQTITLPVHGRV